MATKPVFISYSHANNAKVDQLKRDLQIQNIPLWLDHEILTPGTPNWGNAIRLGIQSAQALVYVASPHAQESDYVVSELDLAKRHQILIYPFWIEGEHWIDAAPIGMGRIQYIDARYDYANALQQLLKYLSKEPIDVSGKWFDTRPDWEFNLTQKEMIRYSTERYSLISGAAKLIRARVQDSNFTVEGKNFGQDIELILTPQFVYTDDIFRHPEHGPKLSHILRLKPIDGKLDGTIYNRDLNKDDLIKLERVS